MCGWIIVIDLLINIACITCQIGLISRMTNGFRGVRCFDRRSWRTMRAIGSRCYRASIRIRSKSRSSTIQKRRTFVSFTEWMFDFSYNVLVHIQRFLFEFVHGIEMMNRELTVYFSNDVDVDQIEKGTVIEFIESLNECSSHFQHYRWAAYCSFFLSESQYDSCFYSAKIIITLERCFFPFHLIEFAHFLALLAKLMIDLEKGLVCLSRIDIKYEIFSLFYCRRFTNVCVHINQSPASPSDQWICE